MKKVDVNVFGQKVSVTGDNAQLIQEYAEYLDTWLRNLSKQYGTLDQKTLFILSGLNLVERIYELEAKNKDLEKELNKVNSLLQTL
ncbi:MAG TPA: cell division protein ZapA [Candidatus Cloacimonadota bacterium]|jgi:cell division protein ZapA (FtsZ GTPase activity inhibitor)|nr:cell division protein ZapA [Candidatus Cloacimonadota bacterium]HOD53721.1 cell division protein ZapA [Candidatus Cloacimonadota bacterium]HPM01208.1 cell division protein ZapA [Candidatus Cloacimonadota bacterium]